MHLWQTSLLLAATGTLVSALPASTNSLQARYTECAANTQWYVCAKNKFVGCCSVDPCDMDDGCPEDGNNGPPAPPTCKPGSETRIFGPEMQAVENGKVRPEIGTDFSVSRTGSTAHDQQMTFKNIPTNAKRCSLGWYAPTDSTFTVDGNGQTYISLVQDDGTLKEIGLANFENWPGSEPAVDHPVTSTDCQETLTFRLHLNPKAKDGEVLLVQNSKSGFYLTPVC
ncbi:hypothetical protein GX51_03617 [Blastomyces parvus]|uniref:Ubiquitin 3 binding protein But2 C-terminal domain-containing protein n=1 Tax=Blastomyces parvus TaxID=2060905 RepID=A0A2B7X694_9EURO|nr:hypothetical protein GX51_03617 [Blastomyces parvus]